MVERSSLKVAVNVPPAALETTGTSSKPRRVVARWTSAAETEPVATSRVRRTARGRDRCMPHLLGREGPIGAASSRTPPPVYPRCLDKGFDLPLGAQRLDLGLQGLLGVALLEELEDPLLDLVEGHHPGGLGLEPLDDVVAEPGLDDAAHLLVLEREGGLLEGLDGLPGGDPGEVASGLLRARVVRVLLGQRGEVAAGLDLGEHAVGLGLGLLLVLGRGVRLEPDQDVPQVEPLGGLHPILVLVV